MPAYHLLQRFLNSLDMKLVARLLDSDLYLKAAEGGLGIFEMDPNVSVVERKQFTPIVEWVDGQHALPAARADGNIHQVTHIRRVNF
jgi:chromosome partitioning protein